MERVMLTSADTSYNPTTAAAASGPTRPAPSERNSLETRLILIFLVFFSGCLDGSVLHGRPLCPRLVQTAGYNQDTIPGTPYIILWPTTGSNTADKNTGKGIISATPVLHTAGHIK